jgi:hypothetical protein
VRSSVLDSLTEAIEGVAPDTSGAPAGYIRQCSLLTTWDAVTDGADVAHSALI